MEAALRLFYGFQHVEPYAFQTPSAPILQVKRRDRD